MLKAVQCDCGAEFCAYFCRGICPDCGADHDVLSEDCACGTQFKFYFCGGICPECLTNYSVFSRAEVEANQDIYVSCTNGECGREYLYHSCGRICPSCGTDVRLPVEDDEYKLIVHELHSIMSRIYNLADKLPESRAKWSCELAGLALENISVTNRNNVDPVAYAMEIVDEYKDTIADQLFEDEY